MLLGKAVSPRKFLHFFDLKKTENRLGVALLRYAGDTSSTSLINHEEEEPMSKLARLPIRALAVVGVGLLLAATQSIPFATRYLTAAPAEEQSSRQGVFAFPPEVLSVLLLSRVAIGTNANLPGVPAGLTISAAGFRAEQ